MRVMTLALIGQLNASAACVSAAASA